MTAGGTGAATETGLRNNGHGSLKMVGLGFTETRDGLGLPPGSSLPMTTGAGEITLAGLGDKEMTDGGLGLRLTRWLIPTRSSIEK